MKLLILTLFLTMNYYVYASLNPLHNLLASQNTLMINSYDEKSGKSANELRAMLSKDLKPFPHPTRCTGEKPMHHIFKNNNSTGYIFTTEKLYSSLEKSAIKIYQIAIQNNNNHQLFTTEEIDQVLNHIALEYPNANNITWEIYNNNSKAKNLAEKLGFTVTTKEKMNSLFIYGYKKYKKTID